MIMVENFTGNVEASHSETHPKEAPKELPPAFEKTAVLSVRAGDVGMERTNEAVLALKGYTAYRDLSEEGKQWVAQVDGFLFASQKQDSLTVGNKTFDPATLDVLRKTSAADARYEIYARALTGQSTSPEQAKEIIESVNHVNHVLSSQTIGGGTVPREQETRVAVDRGR
jgi:hypothetical protein